MVPSPLPPEDRPPRDRPPQGNTFQKKVQATASRKLRARRQRKKVWFGIGMFGLVGWSVSIPTLLGLALGLWLDKHLPSRYSWTIMLLIIGIGLGCLNAWFWVQKESRHE